LRRTELRDWGKACKFLKFSAESHIAVFGKNDAKTLHSLKLLEEAKKNRTTEIEEKKSQQIENEIKLEDLQHKEKRAKNLNQQKGFIFKVLYDSTKHFLQEN
jgi:hypothetical protein